MCSTDAYKIHQHFKHWHVKILTIEYNMKIICGMTLDQFRQVDFGCLQRCKSSLLLQPLSQLP